MHRRLFAVALALLASPVFAAPFTYHGELMDGLAPADGAYDLRLHSYASKDAKAALGEATDLPNVKVTNGSFALELDLPDNPLGDTYVQVAIRKAGTNDAYEVLGAPQAVSKVNQGCWALDGNTGLPPGSFLGIAEPLLGTPLELRARNLRVARFEPGPVGGINGGGHAIALGASSNVASGAGATVGGGGSFNNSIGANCPTCANRAEATFATVAGGLGNVASATGASVLGGVSNRATADGAVAGGGQGNETTGALAVVSGGFVNDAGGYASAVAGGSSNLASGSSAMVAGGALNCAGGDFSLAAGSNAIVRSGTELGDVECNGAGIIEPDQDGDEGTFAWSDSQNTNFISTGPDQFLVRAAGGVMFNTNTLTRSADDLVVRTRASGTDVDVDLSLVTRNGKIARLYVQDSDGSFYLSATSSGSRFLDTSIGASLSTGGVWKNASSRALKHAFATVDSGDILARVLSLPIATWEYKASSEGRHLGPVAEDFKQVFGLAGDGKSIPTVDADGVALAAIQGLNAKLEAENAALRARDARLEADNHALTRRFEALQRRLEKLEFPTADTAR